MSIVREKSIDLIIAIGIVFIFGELLVIASILSIVVSAGINIFSAYAIAFLLIFGTSVGFGLFHLNQQAIVFAQFFCISTIFYTFPFLQLIHSKNYIIGVPTIVIPIWCLYIMRKHKEKFT
jgi:hypothetical protein